MSGLVTGLQNQVQRFESACDLNKKPALMSRFFVIHILIISFHTETIDTMACIFLARTQLGSGIARLIG